MTKISFSGFSGSGKTSLLAEVKKILSLKCKVESIDEIKGKNPFDSDQKSSFISHFFLLSTQVNEENIKAMTGSDYLLCDQSVLDHWINWNDYISGKETIPQLEEKHKALKDLYRLWIQTYDMIFLIRLDLNQLEKREFNNEIRIADLEHVKKIDELYKAAIDADNLKVIEIWNNTTIDESALEIVKFISEFKQKEEEEKKQEAEKQDQQKV
ncbi:MAG: AAA family ATPase [Candidatus Aminicenantes bacterium]|nr:MAG: AAA family ATPase [Candidatus Aminicenantes bacterium]